MYSKVEAVGEEAAVSNGHEGACVGGFAARVKCRTISDQAAPAASGAEQTHDSMISSTRVSSWTRMVVRRLSSLTSSATATRDSSCRSSSMLVCLPHRQHRTTTSAA